MSRRYVEVGRVLLVNTGKEAGNLAVIVDIIDHGRVLVEGPTVSRRALALKRANLTDIVVADLARGASSGVLAAALEAQDIESKWKETAWAKKIAKREVRANLSDFDRFKLQLARKERRTIVNKEFAKLKKAQAKQ
ncbi:putative 60S ribosomal protein L14 [Polychytrium aggregatum]|uniref:putative 60S ribosomal protein L14 n=1 Tax=Polychytrium aggregatum TaxID=110093 RepID=UPI0022FE35BF|nr:putative 60S ribosomal protein L14 [Polychytrium aggregatum]KAI9204851.1 putative 60S ribosomal protein L14 [Polychytrium aggregatum]